MSKVYVGNLEDDISKEDLEDVFSRYGRIEKVWLAQNPPGFGFIEFEDRKDAEDAVKELDGTDICGSRVRVDMARDRRGGRTRGGRGFGFSRGGGGGGDKTCYECGGRGHFARECNRSRGGGGGGGGDKTCYECGGRGHFARDCNRSGGGGGGGYNRSRSPFRR